MTQTTYLVTAHRDGVVLDGWLDREITARTRKQSALSAFLGDDDRAPVHSLAILRIVPESALVNIRHSGPEFYQWVPPLRIQGSLGKVVLSMASTFHAARSSNRHPCAPPRRPTPLTAEEREAADFADEVKRQEEEAQASREATLNQEEA